MPLEIKVGPSGTESSAGPQPPPPTRPSESARNSDVAADGRLWIREFKVTAGTAGGVIDVSELRGRFEIKAKNIQTPNYATVIITNVSKETANKLLQKTTLNKELTIEGGHRGRSGVLFKGQIKQVRFGKENLTDTYLAILATDALGHDFSNTSKSLPAGSTFKDQVDECLKSFEKLGVTKGFIADLGSKKMPRGRVLFGMTRDILRRIAFATNTTWSVQNGKFQMTKIGEGLPGGTVILNSDTGMIGLPTQTMNGVEAKMLLNPRMGPGKLVHINEGSIQRAEYDPSIQGEVTNPNFEQGALSIAADGIYEVHVVEHEGDTHGTPWYTNIICTKKGSGPSDALTARGQGADYRGVSQPDAQGESGGGGGGAP